MRRDYQEAGKTVQTLPEGVIPGLSYTGKPILAIGFVHIEGAENDHFPLLFFGVEPDKLIG